MKAIFTPYIYILFLSLISSSTYAQNWQLKITPTDSISGEILSTISFRPFLTDEYQMKHELDTFQVQLEEKGVFNSKIIFNEINEKTHHYYFTSGNIYKEITLFFEDNNTLKDFFKANNYTHPFNDITIPTANTKQVLQSMVDYFENNGYSFVEIRLINQRIENNKLAANLTINIHKKRTIDKINIIGYEKFPLSFIKYQTPIKIGSVFNKDKISSLSNILHKINFIQAIKEPEVLFTNDSTLIYLYLNKKKAHQFDGLIGFNNTENNSKLKLHGYLDIQLNNLFNKAEQFSVYWQNTTQKQTLFKLSTIIPYLWNSPISLDAHFDLHKQDSTYLTSGFSAGLGYQLNNHIIKTSVQNYTSNLITTSTNLLLNDFTKTLYGLAYFYELESGYPFFPTQFECAIGAYTGHRKTTTENTQQQKATILLNYTWKINQRQFLFVQNQSAKMIGDNFLINELMLIGGTNTIRGFNENQIYSAAYSIFNAEYRLLTAADSYFYSITDYGISKNKVDDTNLKMLGLGLGYVFKVNSGFLNLNYSIGKFSNTSFNFNQSKVHIKWVQAF